MRHVQHSFRIVTCFVLVIWSSASHGAKEIAPNILILVADDVGWADVGYHGSPIKTPHIDALCRSGVELDQHYVAPMCTPTRAALLTGRYWSRFGNTKPNNSRVLPWDTVTLARALRKAGYETHITGKWHLGSSPECGPTKFGFDHSHGPLAGGATPFSHLYKPGPYSDTWHRNDRPFQEEGHVTDLFMQQAVRWIEAKRDNPFFIYVAFTAAHTPFDEPQKWLDAAEHIPKNRRQYAASVQHMDHAIGEILAALDRTWQRDNTLVLFFSDNGGTNGDDSAKYPGGRVNSPVKGLNTPLRGWKASVHEGGIRTPAIISWPGRFEPAKFIAPIHVVDWMPTLCGVAGFRTQKDLKWDGRDVFGPLTDRLKKIPHRTLYWKGVNGETTAIREGDWKLIHDQRDADDTHAELYDLGADPNEKVNYIAERGNLDEKTLLNIHIIKTRLFALLRHEKQMDNDAVPGEDR